jgi:hypothetical protein
VENTMIIEIATAAVMYLAENATATAAESDIPPMKPRAAQHRENKQQQDADPMAAMWDPNWISSVTPVREPGQASGSAKAANPNLGGSRGVVASKPQPRSH